MSEVLEMSEKRKNQIARFVKAAQEFSEAMKDRDGTDEADRRYCQARADVWKILEEPLEK